MKRILLGGVLLLSGCASLGAEIEGLERTVRLVKDRFKNGVYIYRSASGQDDIESVSFNMTGPGQVDMTVRALGLSFVYGFELRYQERAFTSRTRTAKLKIMLSDLDFLGGGGVRARVQKEIAEAIVEQDQLEIKINERAEPE